MVLSIWSWRLPDRQQCSYLLQGSGLHFGRTERLGRIYMVTMAIHTVGRNDMLVVRELARSLLCVLNMASTTARYSRNHDLACVHFRINGSLVLHIGCRMAVFAGDHQVRSVCKSCVLQPTTYNIARLHDRTRRRLGTRVTFDATLGFVC